MVLLDARRQRHGLTQWQSQLCVYILEYYNITEA